MLRNVTNSIGYIGDVNPSATPQYQTLEVGVSGKTSFEDTGHQVLEAHI